MYYWRETCPLNATVDDKGRCKLGERSLQDEAEMKPKWRLSALRAPRNLDTRHFSKFES